MLCEVAWIMASHRKLYLSGWYWKVKQRKGAKRATIALARKILSIIYTIGSIFLISLNVRTHVLTFNQAVHQGVHCGKNNLFIFW